MKGFLDRRLVALEKLQPNPARRVVIVTEDDPAPADADFVIRLVAATAENIA